MFIVAVAMIAAGYAVTYYGVSSIMHVRKTEQLGPQTMAGVRLPILLGLAKPTAPFLSKPPFTKGVQVQPALNQTTPKNDNPIQPASNFQPNSELFP